VPTLLDFEDFKDYIVAVDNVNIEGDDSTLGPPRMTRLDPRDDERVLEIAKQEERPIAQVLRRLVRESLDKKQAA